jgi:hypothetical protein
MTHLSQGTGIASDRPIDRDQSLGLAQLEPRAFVLGDAEEFDISPRAVAPNLQDGGQVSRAIELSLMVVARMILKSIILGTLRPAALHLRDLIAEIL